MKFDPKRKALLTDEGELLKVLSCPMKMCLEQLDQAGQGGHRHCSQCDHRVLDTALLTQETLKDILQEDADACLIVRRYQHNIEII